MGKNAKFIDQNSINLEIIDQNSRIFQAVKNFMIRLIFTFCFYYRFELTIILGFVSQNSHSFKLAKDLPCFVEILKFPFFLCTLILTI